MESQRERIAAVSPVTNLQTLWNGSFDTLSQIVSVSSSVDRTFIDFTGAGSENEGNDKAIALKESED